jgi:predicted nucleic acid-binding protein
MIFLDTNVLARTLQPGHAHHTAAADSIIFLRRSQAEVIVVSPQVITEFYSIATRQVNGLGFAPDQALIQIDQIKADYPMLLEQPAAYAHWERLVRRYRPINRQVFDARHVAFMMTHRISKILTFNDKDFEFYSEIEVLNPFDVLQIPHR